MSQTPESNPNTQQTHSGSGDNIAYRLSGWSLDELIEGSCERVRNYLTYNPNVSEEDRKLCDVP